MRTRRLVLHLRGGVALSGAALALSGAALALPSESESAVRATHLPEVAASLRDKGLSEKDTSVLLDTAHAKGLSAAEAEELLGVVLAEADASVPVASLAAFAKTRLEAGVRGKDLAEAIHAEKAAHAPGAP